MDSLTVFEFLADQYDHKELHKLVEEKLNHPYETMIYVGWFILHFLSECSQLNQMARDTLQENDTTDLGL